jgi:hypothetical protein
VLHNVAWVASTPFGLLLFCCPIMGECGVLGGVEKQPIAHFTVWCSTKVLLVLQAYACCAPWVGHLGCLRENCAWCMGGVYGWFLVGFNQ